MKEIALSIEFWKFAAPLFGAVIAWFVNEWRKRIWKQYHRKEESYKELLRCLQGFYEGTDPKLAKELKSQFLMEVNKCWLYCPDDVIHKAYIFLDTVKDNQHPKTDNEKEKAVGNFVAAIRKDLLSRKVVYKTHLKENDFKHYKST
ncbi:hypothetical protein C0W44_10430 [Photobacterium leiognathi subsp. mandapamensis]|nr:hypothetical protein C0W44_10430 [Photobacterium leiognathi subsp. mandapamensis]